MRLETSPLDARVVSFFWLEESLATVPDALVVEDAFEELGCCVEAVVELSLVLLFALLFVSFDAVRPVPVAGSVAAAPAVGGVLAAVSVELLVPLPLRERLEESDAGVVAVPDALRFVSLASEEPEVDEERAVSADVF